MTLPAGLLGLDVRDLVEDAVRALVDLVVPDAGAHWVSSLVTWLVALPPVTGRAFPSLNRYAEQLTAVGFGLLGACLVAGLLQVWAGGLTGATGAETVRRAAVAGGVLAVYPKVLEAVLLAVNVLTAAMIRHPLVQDGLDQAFGEALAVSAITGGLSLGLAAGAAVCVLYFAAALMVLKIGLTALLAVAVISGALVWGLYPLPAAGWLARAWTASLFAALVVPVAWACVFAAAALLAADTLVFEGGGQFNNALGESLAYLVKPLAAVACFWVAYRAPHFLLGLARGLGLGGVVGSPTGGAARPGGRGGPASVAARGVRINADRFRALTHRTPFATAGAGRRPTSPRAPSAATRSSRKGPLGAASAASAANAWWRRLPVEGAALRRERQATGAPSAARTRAPAARAAAPTSRTQTSATAGTTTNRRAASSRSTPVPPSTRAPAARTSVTARATPPPRPSRLGDAPRGADGIRSLASPAQPAGSAQPRPPAPRPARPPAPPASPRSQNMPKGVSRRSAPSGPPSPPTGCPDPARSRTAGRPPRPASPPPSTAPRPVSPKPHAPDAARPAGAKPPPRPAQQPIARPTPPRPRPEAPSRPESTDPPRRP